MKILVLNGSPKGENSVTLQTVRYLEKKFPAHSFEVLHVGQRIKSIEKDFSKAEEALNNAELLLFSYPVYTFLVPSQLHRFIELVKERGVDVSGRYAAQITTSLHFYDVTAHRFIRDNCDDLGLLYLGGLSVDMEDLLKAEGRRQAEDFFRHLMWRVERGIAERPLYPVQKEQKPFVPMPVNGSVQPSKERSGRRIAIVADLQSDALRDMVERFTAVTAAETVLVNLREFPFAGGCLGCFHCAADGTCVYRDGFDTFLRERIQGADAIVYAFSVRDHSMGSRMKLFDDRQFCNGHRTVTMGKPVGYLIDGALDAEPNLRMLIESRAEVGGNCLAGIATNERDPAAEIEALSETLGYAIETHYQPPKNFYGVGGMKVFRDLIYQMRGLMKEDHRFYKAHGFYDFPQKRKGRIIGMYLVGAMMRSKKIQKKIGGKMTEGMLLPYKKALEKAEKE
ncbi:MAG: NAD(P)H-dependent oxidoreductase [Clostridia bacterium]|nr:NAD(P)H-dependent oxidoreductase [Clostridia bacterium]